MKKDSQEYRVSTTGHNSTMASNFHTNTGTRSITTPWQIYLYPNSFSINSNCSHCWRWCRTFEGWRQWHHATISVFLVCIFVKSGYDYYATEIITSYAGTMGTMVFSIQFFAGIVVSQGGLIDNSMPFFVSNILLLVCLHVFTYLCSLMQALFPIRLVYCMGDLKDMH